MSTPRQFTPASQARGPFFVGIDLGGTSIKIGVVDDLGRSLSWHGIPTDATKGPLDASRRTGQAVLSAIEMAGLAPGQIARVGLGSPGTMDVPKGMLLDPPNLPGWQNFPLRDEVSKHCGKNVTFANDACAAAFGEFWIGAGRELHSLVLFTLGTGVGCGIIIGDHVIDGEHSHGAECGHLIIDYRDDARMCPCGQRGHLEAYASATSVVKRTQEALASGRASSLSARVAAGEVLSPVLLAEEADKGDALSLEIILETGRFLGVGVVNVMHAIDPDGVLIGGAMTFGENETALGRRFLARVREEVHKRAFPVLAKNTRVDYASLGADAGYIGAAGLARRDYIQGL